MNSRRALVPIGIHLLGNVNVDGVGLEPIRDYHRRVIVDIRGNAVAPLALEVLTPMQLYLHLGLCLGGIDVLRQSVERKIRDGPAGGGARLTGCLRRRNERHPKKVQPAFPDHECDVVTFYVRGNCNPAGPRGVRVGAVEIFVGMAVGAPENVQGADTGVRRILVQVHGNDIQTCALVELLQIREKCIVCEIGGDVPLKQAALEGLEQVGRIEAQLRHHPILREEKNLAVRLPDAIAFHPFPPVRINGAGGNVDGGVAGVAVFEIEKAALDEGLQG